MSKFLRSDFAWFGLLIFCSCQGAPNIGYNTDRGTPGVHAKYGRFKADANANGSFVATNVDAGGTMFDRHFKADMISMNPDVTQYWGGLSAQGQVYGQQQLNFGNSVLPAYGQAAALILQQIPPIIQAATPLLGPYLNSLGAAKLAAASRPSIAQSLADLVRNGGTTATQLDAVFGHLDPELLNQIKALLGGNQILSPISDAAKRDQAYTAQNRIFNEQIVPSYSFPSVAERPPAYAPSNIPPTYAGEPPLIPSEIPERPSTTRAEIQLPENVGNLDRRS